MLPKRYRWTIVFCILFVIGMLICFARTPYSILSPVMYTEDGEWTSMLIRDGFLATCLIAKPTYLVVGNLALLQLSLSLNTLFFGLNITSLPVIIAIVSYAYYSFVALLPLILLRRILDWRALLALWGLILILPVGIDISEIYGRISNIGYGCFFLGFTILAWFCFDRRVHHVASIIFAYLAMILLCMTNPACYLQLATMFIFELCRAIKRKSLSKASFARYICMAIISLASLVLMLSIQRQGINEADQMLSEISSPEGVIACLFRSIAFDFCWPLYRHFNTISAVIALGLIVAFFALVIIFTRTVRYQKLMAFSYAWTIAFTLVTLFMRAGLTGILEGYESSFPDRYFYAQGILIYFDLCLAISAVLSGAIDSRPIRAFIVLLCCYLVAINVYKWGIIFEVNGSRAVNTDLTFAESLRITAESDPSEEGLYVVPIEFDGWEMILPSEYLEESVKG